MEGRSVYLVNEFQKLIFIIRAPLLLYLFPPYLKKPESKGLAIHPINHSKKISQARWRVAGVFLLQILA